MILAAGLGTRLFPLTIDRTKPAIPFHGRPLVGYVAEYLASFGFEDIVVNLHHQPDSVRTALGDGSEFGVRIHYIEELPDILGTAGALENARSLLDSETFLVINGKIITDIDLNEAIATHRRSGALATMVLLENTKREKFTEVLTEDGSVTGFGSMPDPSSTGPVPLMFTGIQILEPGVFDYIPKGVYSDIVPAFYRPAIENGEKIGAHVSSGHWYEMSTIKRYLDISLAMLAEGDVVTGRSCDIAHGATVTESVLWDNVQVLEGASLTRTVVGDKVTIPAGASYSDVAIVRADLVRASGEIPEKASAGRYDGDNYLVTLE